MKDNIEININTNLITEINQILEESKNYQDNSTQESVNLKNISLIKSFVDKINGLSNYNDQLISLYVRIGEIYKHINKYQEALENNINLILYLSKYQNEGYLYKILECIKQNAEILILQNKKDLENIKITKIEEINKLYIEYFTSFKNKVSDYFNNKQNEINLGILSRLVVLKVIKHLTDKGIIDSENFFQWSHENKTGEEYTVITKDIENTILPGQVLIENAANKKIGFKELDKAIGIIITDEQQYIAISSLLEDNVENIVNKIKINFLDTENPLFIYIAGGHKDLIKLFEFTDSLNKRLEELKYNVITIPTQTASNIQTDEFFIDLAKLESFFNNQYDNDLINSLVNETDKLQITRPEKEVIDGSYIINNLGEQIFLSTNNLKDEIAIILISKKLMKVGIGRNLTSVQLNQMLNDFNDKKLVEEKLITIQFIGGSSNKEANDSCTKLLENLQQIEISLLRDKELTYMSAFYITNALIGENLHPDSFVVDCIDGSLIY